MSMIKVTQLVRAGVQTQKAIDGQGYIFPSLSLLSKSFAELYQCVIHHVFKDFSLVSSDMYTAMKPV